ncbi:acid phosphatase, putative [Talaromyces stipitatus ATCC 10500]|uniref:Acid phosphatase, putative n=1 Tax=Talaromyces stipitatus (strain ATCC 10500 / CBS 375.48 / QM 6759 / NRRL 1006) TaxID=441959 RepID=B8MFE8_TALSN|nr:acid phosphatase, putative [Talaromyces stipitatus ATCC 10500]XP_002483917.1 acid phosphatase, putative [Talaromyces stipitatus ATCC 10500]EED16682.1 acid phosphatase, putative [Talaromyces stipitatus ATCC 10500]EED16683.1 acid phosphatase, putative [Talaromyces stipitatus ATCC 10500]
MHILVVNDDGPPSQKLSPYIRPFVDALEDAGHRVSVAIPAASRSWIGKAHIIGASLTATYVHPDSFQEDGTWVEEDATEDHSKPAAVTTNSHLPPTPAASTEHLNVTGSAPVSPEDYWVVVTNGTPASCTQLGIYELFPDRGPIDLVISGPNHGRNASTIYNLSSGTVGGALEAATCGKRGIALSFGSKDEQPREVIAAAARLSTRVIEHLYRNWSDKVELYNLNVPMREDVESRPVRYTSALRNEWTKGSLYAEVGNHGTSDEDGDKDTLQRKGKPNRVRQFQWSTELSDIKKSLAESLRGTDARTVLDGYTSVTPLKANFWHPSGFSGDLQLDC